VNWEGGDNANGPITVSSFEALDAILGRLADRTIFPNLKTVVLAGHSGGAQVVQHYAIVGKGEDQLNYALGLSQSQVTSYSAADSTIRDADIAAEAANLTKTQIVQQAAVAAMAQANTSAQAVLALLKGS